MHPIIVFAAFVFFAISYNMLGPITADIMASTGMSLSDSGRIVSFQQIGSLMAIALSYLVLRRMKQTTVALIGYGILIVSLIFIAASRSVMALFILYTAIGVGSFMVDSGSNALLSSEYYHKRATYISMLHFLYSVGAILSGYLVLPFKGPQWRWAYASIGIIIAIILCIGIFFKKHINKDTQDNPRKVDATPKPEKILLKDPAFLLYTTGIGLYMGSQIICAAWVPVYVETELQLGPALTATSLMMFWVGTAASRLIIGPLLKRGAKPYTLSTWGMVLAGLGLIIATITENVVVVMVAIGLCGFFNGATIPMYMVVVPSWYPGNAAFIATSYIFGGTIGRMVFPYLVTRIAEGSSLAFSLRLSSILLFACAILIALVKRIARDRTIA